MFEDTRRVLQGATKGPMPEEPSYRRQPVGIRSRSRTMAVNRGGRRGVLECDSRVGRGARGARAERESGQDRERSSRLGSNRTCKIYQVADVVLICRVE